MFSNINKVVKALVFSDLLLLFGWGLIDPILAVYVLQNIKGGDATVVGVAVGIYWLLKSIVQIPIARFLDKRAGEKDDFYAVIFGTLIAALIPLGLIFAKEPWHLYLIQTIHAMSIAFALTAWCGIFTRHIEKGKEAFSWSLDSSALGLGAGVAGIVGGVFVKIYGFTPLLLGVAVFGVLSVLVMLPMKKHLFLEKEKDGSYPVPKPF
ncbi:MAG: MFS transporter [Patescibacteria group bacterium]|nr:MFS transporter [Patescibacteria group bacterium]